MKVLNDFALSDAFGEMEQGAHMLPILARR